MQLSSDENSKKFPVDGSSALEVEAVSEIAPSGRKKKSRRKNKKNAVTYALETETQEPEVRKHPKVRLKIYLPKKKKNRKYHRLSLTRLNRKFPRK